MSLDGGGPIVGEARVRLRPSTSTFASEAATGLDPQLAAVEGRVHASGGRISTALQGLSRNLGSFGIPFAGALDSVDRALIKTGGNAQTFAQKLSAFGAGEIIALAAVGVASVEMATNEEAAHARLENAIGRVGLKYSEVSGQIDQTEAKQRKLGITDTDTANSMSRLVLATHDVRKASELEGVAADVSAGRHKSLDQATQALVQAEGGRYMMLGRMLGISKDQIATIHSEHDAIKLVTDLYGGAAQRQAHTFAGELQALRAEGEHVGVTIGEKVIPVVRDLAGGLVTGIQTIESINRATDGWVGKLALAGAAIPIAVFAGEKLWNVGGRIVGQYGKVGDAFDKVVGTLRGTSAATEAAAAADSAAASVSAGAASERATSEGLVSAAIAERVAAQEAAILADQAQAAGDGEVVTATSIRIAAEGAELDAQAALMRARAFAVNASGAQAAADLALSGVQDELTTSFVVNDVALTKLTETSATAAAATLAAAAADQAETAAELELAGAVGVRTAAQEAEAGAQLGTGVGAAGGAATGAVTGLGAALVAVAAAAVVAVPIAIALRSIGTSAYLSDKDIKQLNEDLLKGGKDSAKAASDLGKQYGGEAAAGLQKYSNLLLAGASAKDLDAQKSKVMAAALDHVTATFHGAGLGADNLTFKLSRTRKEVDDQVNGLDDLNKKYGASAVQSAVLSAAQKHYADLLAGGTASEHQLAVARLAVVNASRQHSVVQDQVNAATDAGTQKTAAAATAAFKYKSALDALHSDIASGHTVRGQLAKDWADVESTAFAGVSSQVQLTSILQGVGLQAIATAGDVISLAMAEASLGNYSANAVTSFGNLTTAAGEQSAAQFKVQDSTTAYTSAVDQLTKAQSGAGGGGGAAGATKNATAALLDQEQKMLTLRDARKADARAMQTVADDQVALTKARADEVAADVKVTAAEKHLDEVLHGVSKSSQEAKDATENLAKARLSSESAALDERDAELALADAHKAAKDSKVASAAAIAAAEMQLQAARETGDPQIVALAEKGLKDARSAAATTAASDSEKIQRAEIALKEKKWAERDATKAQNEAQRIYHGTLDGFPAKSAEAKAATDALTQAKKDDQSATDAVTSAEHALADAQDQTANTALALQRAQADVRGELNQAPAAAGRAAAAMDNVASKMAGVRTAAQQMATDLGLAVLAQGGTEVQALTKYADVLQSLEATNPLLKGVFDATIANVRREIASLNSPGHPVYDPAHDLGRSPGGHRKSAAGSDLGEGEWTTAGEGTATELIQAKPGGGVRVFSHGDSLDVASDRLFARSRRDMPVQPAVMQPKAHSSAGAGHGSFPTANEIAAALAPMLKQIQVSGNTFVALNPEELAAAATAKMSFELAGRLG